MHRRVLLFVLMAAFLLSFIMIQVPISARPPYAGTPAPSGVKGIVVSSETLRIRVRPDTTSAEAGSPLKPQTTVFVLGKNDTGVWLVVKSQTGVTGWVSSAYIALLAGSSMKDVPTVADTFVEDSAAAATAEGPEGTPCSPESGGTPAPLTGAKGIVVTSDSLRIRKQPFTTAPEVTNPLKPQESVTVLGRNDTGTWLIVQTRATVIGWVGSAYVQLMGSAKFNDLPVMDDNAVDTLTAQAASGSAACPPEGTPAATKAAPATGVKGIVVSSQTLRIRSKPDTTSPEVASPLKPSVSVIVLGRNDTGVWLYIQTLSGDKGWVSSAYVALVAGGSMKNVPVVDDSGNPM